MTLVDPMRMHTQTAGDRVKVSRVDPSGDRRIDEATLC
jgi:hypothetical protein